MLLIILLIFMIVGAIIALETKNLLSAVIAVGAVGAGVSICFLMLGAPDIAITQMAVETLSLVILIRATISRDLTHIRAQREAGGLIAIGVFVAIFVVFSVFALMEMPPFGKPLMTVSSYYVQNGLAQTGASNIISAIILDYRGYDTLGEATILFVAVAGAIVLLRKKGRKKVGEKDE